MPSAFRLTLFHSAPLSPVTSVALAERDTNASGRDARGSAARTNRQGRTLAKKKRKQADDGGRWGGRCRGGRGAGRLETGDGWGLGGSWGVIYIVLRLPRPRTLGHQSPGVGAEPPGRPAGDKYGSRWRSSRSSRGRNEWAEQTRKMSHQGECGDIKAARQKRKGKKNPE